ncbi:MAG: hypothetical protein HZR80_05125 [Candidatus Heimdallarchaeota archaeon]
MKDPKCPECGNTVFAYQGVALESTLSQALEKTAFNRKDSIGEHLKKVAEYEKKGHKTAVLHNMLEAIKQGNSKAILIYCPNCGTIIGTAGKDNV